MTDIVKSTRLWAECPLEMAQALEGHDALALSVAERWNGEVIKERGEGDSLFIFFSDPTEAVQAAVDLLLKIKQERFPPPVSLKLRAALHTGTAEQRSGDYYGPVVNRCARLRALANPDQILLTRATREAVDESKLGSISLVDAGTHFLRDVAIEQVSEAVHPDLPTDNREVGGRTNFAVSLNALGVTGLELKEYEAAEQLLLQAINIFRSLGNDVRLAMCINNLGIVFVNRNEYVAAEKCYREALEVNERIDHWEHSAGNLVNLADLRRRAGDASGARALCIRASDIFVSHNHESRLADNLTQFAEIERELGRPHLADMLQSCCSKYLGVPPPEVENEWTARGEFLSPIEAYKLCMSISEDLA